MDNFLHTQRKSELYVFVTQPPQQLTNDLTAQTYIYYFSGKSYKCHFIHKYFNMYFQKIVYFDIITMLQ